MVTAVDRGRWTCAPDGDPAREPVTAMRARELGRTPIVVGDRVGLVGDLSGAPDTLARIVRVEERSTVLRRTADDTDPVERVVVANAEQLVIVTAVADPAPRTGFVDRCLVAAYAGGLAPLLCLTKADLADPEPFAAQYARAGAAGAVDAPRRARPRRGARGRCSPAGCRRSSGTPAWASPRWSTPLVPDADRRGRAWSSAVGKGRHTDRRGDRAAAARRPPAAGWSTPPACGRSGWPTSRRTTSSPRSTTSPPRSRTARAAAATSGRRPTRNARSTRSSPRAAAPRPARRAASGPGRGAEQLTASTP